MNHSGAVQATGGEVEGAEAGVLTGTQVEQDSRQTLQMEWKRNEQERKEDDSGLSGGF